MAICEVPDNDLHGIGEGGQDLRAHLVVILHPAFVFLVVALAISISLGAGNGSRCSLVAKEHEDGR